jgi:hypothetical protein
MRILVLLTMCLAGFAGQQPAASPEQAAKPAANAPDKGRQMVDQMIAALGGQAYLNVQDSYTNGRYGRFHNEAMVGGAVYFRYWRWPDQERYELTKERDIVNLYLGDKAWEVTFRGGRELNPEKDENVQLALIRRHFSLERVLRQWLSAPGTIVLDEGPMLADNKMAQKITIINAQNEAASILVSPDTHLPIQKSFTIRDPKTRDRDTEDEIYDNWRMVQGVNTPFSVVVKRNGQIIRQQYLFNASYNTNPPESYFTPILIKHPDSETGKKK